MEKYASPVLIPMLKHVKAKNQITPSHAKKDTQPSKESAKNVTSPARNAMPTERDSVIQASVTQATPSKPKTTHVPNA